MPVVTEATERKRTPGRRVVFWLLLLPLLAVLLLVGVSFVRPLDVRIGRRVVYLEGTVTAPGTLTVTGHHTAPQNPGYHLYAVAVGTVQLLLITDDLP